MEVESTAAPVPLDEWHEDDGFALWWVFPVNEPPYVGSPLCSDWPGYHTHFTPIPIPNEPAARATGDHVPDAGKKPGEKDPNVAS